MSRLIPISIFALLILLISCSKDQMLSVSEYDTKLENNIKSASETGNLDYYILPDEDDLANIPQDPKNPLTADKVALGKFLFYETGLATTPIKEEGFGTYSCATCHIPEAGFRPGKAQGVADGGLGFGIKGEKRVRNINYEEDELDVQSARPLSMLNVAFVTNTMWNGSFGPTGANIGTEHLWEEFVPTNLLGFEGIEAQNIEGFEIHRMHVDQELVEEYGYKELFDSSFPEYEESERYNNITASLAVSAYIRTLFSNKAPFQEWLKGKSEAMTVEEKKGAILFFGKARCSACHHGPNLGSGEFHALGVNDMFQRASFNAFEDDKRNLGRGGFTLVEEDNYKFKVPQLYNLKDTPFYFHGASKQSLRDVIDYKDAATRENENVPVEQMSPKFQQLDLTEEEKVQLLQFLDNGLRDPDLQRYKPSSIGSGLCFPNNDPQSSIEIGCE